MVSVFLVAAFLGMRAWWIASENDEVISWTTIAMTFVAATIFGWAGFRNLHLFLATGFTAMVSSACFALECVFHSPASQFHRAPVPSMYYDDPTLNTLTVLFATVILPIPAGTWAIVLRNSKACVLKYRLEILISSTCGVVLGMTALCINHFFLRFGENVSVLLGSLAIGTLLGAAFVYTRVVNQEEEGASEY